MFRRASLSGDFLDRDELLRFQEDYDQFPRQVTEESHDRITGQYRKNREALDLQELVRERLQDRPTDTSSRGFECFLIRVHEHDGMSWSSTAVDELVQKVDPKLPRIHLTGQNAFGKLPEIARIMSPRQFAALAQKHGLTNSFPLLKVWVVAGLFSLAIGLSVAANVLNTINKNATASALSIDDFLNLSYILGAVIAAAATVAVQQVTNWLKTDINKSKAMAELATELGEGAGGTPYKNFVKELAERLTKIHLPRCVIVDAYHALDDTTKEVIYRYLRSYATVPGRFELWVVFESWELSQLYNKVSTTRNYGIGEENHGFKQTRRFELDYLSPEDRRLLADYNGTPERSEYLTVSAIRHPERDTRDKVIAFLDQYYSDTMVPSRERISASESSYGPLELFYLLSLTCAWGGNLSLLANYVEDSFVPQEEPLRPEFEVLRAFLHGTTLDRAEFHTRLNDVLESFRPYVEQRGAGRSLELHIRREVGEALSERSRAYGLPDPRLGHLFWALLWRHKLRQHPLQAFWIRKITTHVLHAEPPRALDKSLPENVSGALFETILFVIDKCLKLSLLDDVPALLDKALSLVDPKDAGSWKTRSHDLYRVCWDAYSVLGDDQLLAIPLRLQSWRVRKDRRKPLRSAAPVDDLFLQSLGIWSDHLQTPTELATGAWRRAGPAAQTYGRIRIVWLALLLQHYLVPASARLQLVSTAGGKELNELVNGALDRLEHRGSGSTVVSDAISVSLGLWCMLLSVIGSQRRTSLPRLQEDAPAGIAQGGDEENERASASSTEPGARLQSLNEFIEILASVCLAAGELHEQRATSDTAEEIDFALDVLGKELLFVVISCAALIAKISKEDQALNGLSHAQVPEVIAWAFRTLGLRSRSILWWKDLADVELVEELQEQMDLLQITWRSLGFRQLSAFMGLRRAHFEFVAKNGDDAAAVLHRLETILPIELESADYEGLLTNALIAEGVKSSQEMAARFLCEAAKLGIESDFGNELTIELCWLALGHAHAYSKNVYYLTPSLQYLLASDQENQGRPHLAQALDALPDDQIEPVSLWLLNVLTELDDFTHRAISILMDRVSRISDLKNRDQAQQRIDLFNLSRDLRGDKPIATERIIEEWRPRPSDRLAWVLYLLLMHGSTPVDPLVREAKDVLQGHPGPTSFSSYVQLAKALAYQLHDSSWLGGQHEALRSTTLRVAIQFLKREMPRWEGQLSTDETIEIYQILIALDPESRPSHFDRVGYWQAISLERDRLNRLPSLVQDRKFFELFLHYFRVISLWQPRLDIPLEEMSGLLSIGPDQRKQAVRSWRAKGAKVPNPFILVNKRLSLSSDFLRYGHYLFSMPNLADEQLDDARRQFDDAARAGLDTFYKEVISLGPMIPAVIRDVLQRHKESLDEFTLPV